MAKYGFNVKIGADTRPFEEGIAKLGKSMQSVGKKLEKASNDLKVISAAAAGALVGIVKTSSDFEDAWVGVTKTVTGTEEELAKVRQEIIDMSKATGISKNDIAGVAQAAGQLGISTKDLSSFTKVMVDLGIATNMTAEEAAMSLARFANITQMSSKDFDRLGATITDLGNNYAITEKEIVDMATRLASTGDLVGLNQAQIMALATAMGSLGSESEAGGTAMSKMFRKMQLAIATNNKQLSQFAEVSGMSVDEFKKAFEKDALGALNSFVKGLAKIQDNGGSAIAKLDEMKLSEVRLSDATLRLVGSGDLLDRAIETANSAWEENTALTKEAEKRYGELKYEWGKLKETIGELAINLGEVLLPILKDVAKKATEWVGDLTKKLNGMTKSQKEQFLKLLGVIALISPALKVAGSSISLLGKAIKALSNPINLAAFAAAGLVGTAYAISEAHNEEIYGLKGLKSTLDEEREAWRQSKEARAEAMDSSMAEIGITENLAGELDKMVDKNGKVKEGYEDRAKFIVGELQKALGIEIGLNDGIIDGYKDLRGEINKLINTKKAEILLDAYKDQYAQALKDRGKAIDNLIELEKQLGEASEKAWSGTGREAYEARQKFDVIGQEISKQKGLIGEYGYTLKNYEELQTAMVSGTAEEIEKASNRMVTSYEKSKTASEESVAVEIENQLKRITAIRTNLGEAEKIQDGYQAHVYQKQLETEEQQLTSLYDSLVEQVKLINQLTPEQEAAFKTLAESDLVAYQNYVNQLSPEMQKELAKVTGVITSNNSVENATIDMANDALSFFTMSTEQMSSIEAGSLYDTEKTITSNTAIPQAAAQLGRNTSKEFKDNSNGEESGEHYSSGVAVGIAKKAGEAIAAARRLASNLLETMHSGLREGSPSKATAEMGEFFVQGFTQGVLKSQSNAVNAVKRLASSTLDAYQSGMKIDGLKGKMTNDMINTAKVVYTKPDVTIYTQELDSQKLDQIVKHVDRVFGAAM